IEDACSVANYIHFSIKNIRTSPRFSSKIHQRQHFTRELKLTKTLVSAFRSVLHDYQKNLSDQLATTLETLNVIDENISFSLEREWIKPLESQMLHEDALLRKSIQDFLSQELQYRERFTFLRAQPKGMTTEEKKEIFSYRLGLLKKFVQRNLYLDVTYETNNSYLVQSAAMFAAGIAAAFAYSIELLNRGHYRMDWSYDAGLLLFLSTFAYIIKDRIKDVIKSLFAKHFSSFDLRRNISLPSVSKKPFAHSLESVKVCRSKEIPKQILKKRNRTLLKGMKRHKHETVIYYSKLLSINWNVIQQPDRPPHNIIKEIHRFNLSKMFERMDNPVKSMKFYDPVTQQVVERTIPKVYHLNVVLSFTPVKGRKKTPIGKPSICKARLILNKEGIKRVEIDD
ncbi:MAG: hypothetical protein KDD55_11960, partial [Bdellovibrionales bacterium]|nr:hypothetical protein [Bdellovibrionales bacterium]